jgi:hypothetical protein
MGKRGPQSRLGGRRSPLVFRPDEETIVALTQDLADLRAVRGPRASMADVLRSWGRNSSARRAVAHEAQLLERIDALQQLDRVRAQELAELRAEVAGFRDKTTREQAHDIEVAVRSLDTNPRLVEHVQDLVKLEAGGLVATSSYPLLQRARRSVASWQDLLHRRKGMHHDDNRTNPGAPAPAREDPVHSQPQGA